jgi:hypothetical protein
MPPTAGKYSIFNRSAIFRHVLHPNSITNSQHTTSIPSLQLPRPGSSNPRPNHLSFLTAAFPHLALTENISRVRGEIMFYLKRLFVVTVEVPIKIVHVEPALQAKTKRKEKDII